MSHFVLTKPIQNWLHFFIAHSRSIFVFLFIFDKLCATSYFLHWYWITMPGLHVLCFVEKVSYCLRSKPRAALLFHTFELLLCWSVYVILHNTQNIPFPSIYAKYQIPVSSDFGSSGSKIYVWVYFSLVLF